MKNIFPFDYYKKPHEYVCPKCARVEGTPDRSPVCTGGWNRFWQCPKIEHFHRKCEMCKGEWLEATYESSTIRSVVVEILTSSISLDTTLTEDELLSIWREAQVRKVHDSLSVSM